MNTIDTHGFIQNTSEYISGKISVLRIILIVMFFIILYIITRLKYTINDITDNWHIYECKYPYSIFGGYLAPDGIKGDKSNEIFTGMEGSRIHFKRCNEKIFKAVAATKMGPTVDQYDENVQKMKNQVHNVAVIKHGSQNVSSIIGAVLKKVLKYVLGLYYIIIYMYEKLKMVLQKLQLTIEIVINSFKSYINIVHHILFTLIPATLELTVNIFSMGLYTLLASLLGTVAVAGGAGTGLRALGRKIFGRKAFKQRTGISGLPLVYAMIGLGLVKSRDVLKRAGLKGGIGRIKGLDEILSLGGVPTASSYVPGTSAYVGKLPTMDGQAANSLITNMKVISLALNDDSSGTCLTENVLIKLKDGNVKVKDIKIGDIQEDGSTITGMVKYPINFVSLYDYKGIIMTASHYIKIKNDFYPCGDMGKYMGTYVKELYCPITSNGLISAMGTEDVILADYNDGKSYTKLNYLTDSRLHKKIRTIRKYKQHNYPALFADKDIISNSQLSGRIVHKYTPDIKLYDYHGIIVSGNVLVHENGDWVRIWQTNAKETSEHPEYLYNCLTSSHIVNFKNHKFRDYEEL